MRIKKTLKVKFTLFLIVFLIPVIFLATPLISFFSHAQAQSSADWPMFGYDSEGSRYNPYENTINSSNVSNLALGWIGLTGEYIGSSPSVYNGVVYVGSESKLYAFAVGCNSGGAACQPLWTGNTGATTYSSPSGDNGIIYINSYTYEVNVGNVAKLYAFAAGGCGSSTCPPLWTADIGFNTTSSPVVADGTVYVGSSDGILYAFTASGCGSATCSPVWTGTYYGSNNSSPVVAPTIANGIVYIGDVIKLYAFNANGCGQAVCAPLWTANTGTISSWPAVVNGLLYIGSQDHKLYAFNANGCGQATCQPLWTALTGNMIISAPAIANGVVYIGSTDSNLYAFNASGCGNTICSPIWTTNTGGSIVSAPAVANGVVYVGSFGGFFAYNASGCNNDTCSPLWTANVGAFGTTSSPTVSNGWVYIGSPNHTLYAFSLNGAIPTLTPTPPPTVTPTPTPTPPQPFLDLPFNYEGMDFKEIIFNPNSWFDHEYPLQNIPCCILKVRRYDSKEIEDFYRSHSGYDYGLKHGVRLNTPVLAAASGWATFKPEDKSSGAGNMIKIDHDNGYQTWYEHLMNDGLIVNIEGQKVFVEKGQKIGKTGYTGNSYPKDASGAHIHFSVFKDINNNGNFDDDYPYGLVDPLGWEGDYVDPWTEWPSKDAEKRGAPSYNLFIKKTQPKSQIIPQTGDTLKTDDNKLQIEVPSNAADSPFTLTHKYGPFEFFESEGISFESIVPSFFLDAVNTIGEKITQFREPFRIIYSYSGPDVLNVKETTLLLYFFDELLGKWVPLPSVVDTANKTVTALTTHNSHFALMGEVKDKIPPTTEIVIHGDKGQDNWYRSKVTVELNGKDNEGGIGLEYTLYSLDNENWQIYSDPLDFDQEGEHALTYQSFDKAGNEGERNTITFRIDTIPPSVISRADRIPDVNEWYNDPVTVTFTGQDTGSGIAKCAGPIIYNKPDNAYAFVEGSCADKAGNIASASSNFKYDSTNPVLTASASSKGAPYASSLWTNSDVQVMFNCADETSGVNTVSQPIIISTEGKDQSIKGDCEDNAGNKSEINFIGINIDKTKPLVSIKATPDTIWPPNGKMVEVLISGNIVEENLKDTTFKVTDEYGLIEPAITHFDQTIQLEAKRNGSDKDGRKYHIKALAEDLAGNTGEAVTTVVVPHDQGK